MMPLDIAAHRKADHITRKVGQGVRSGRPVLGTGQPKGQTSVDWREWLFFAISF